MTISEPIVRLPRARAPGIPDLLGQNTGLLLVLGLFGAYVRPLTRSLWVDETNTLWMARGGPFAAFQKTSHWPGQSILYSVLTSFFCFEGSPLRDLLLRLPALLGGIAAGYILYRFAQDVFGEGAGRIAAAVFAFSPATIEMVTQARPYGLAMAAAAASCWTLYRWTGRRERKWLPGYVLSSALVLYLHYMFAVVFAAHAALLAWELFRNRNFHRAWELIAACAVIVALVIPLASHMMLLVREAHTLPFMPKPTRFMLADVLMPSVYVAGLFAAALIVHFGGPGGGAERVYAPTGIVAMLLVWWALGPILAFVISNASSMEMFVPRYLSYSALALSLMLTFAGYAIFGAARGLTWVLLGSLLTTASPLGLLSLSEPGKEELRPVMDIIRNESVAQAIPPPVLYRSELPESAFYDWRAGNAPNSYLFAPFVAYPMPNALLPLPYRLTQEVKDYVADLIAVRLKDNPKVILATTEPFSVTYFDERFEQAGFKSRWAHPNNFYVAVFERSPAKP